MIWEYPYFRKLPYLHMIPSQNHDVFLGWIPLCWSPNLLESHILFSQVHGLRFNGLVWGKNVQKNPIFNRKIYENLWFPVDFSWNIWNQSIERYSAKKNSRFSWCQCEPSFSYSERNQKVAEWLVTWLGDVPKTSPKIWLVIETVSKFYHDCYTIIILL